MKPPPKIHYNTYPDADVGKPVCISLEAWGDRNRYPTAYANGNFALTKDLDKVNCITCLKRLALKEKVNLVRMYAKAIQDNRERK